TGTATAPLTNYGTITGGVSLGAGSVVNGSTASGGRYIQGSGFGVKIGGLGAVSNRGTVAATAGNGVYLGGGGNVVNYAGARISGSLHGIYMRAAGSVGNYGTIAGGVLINGNGAFVNGKAGAAAAYGVSGGVNITGTATAP